MILTILGCTATGKTHLAVRLAAVLGGEIISADSRQVYRGMDIGTGKDLGEYTFNGIRVPCHLIDICPAGSEYNLHMFLTDADEARKQIMAKGKVPILCGGSGLYLEAYLKGFHLADVPANQDLRGSLEEKSTDELITLLSSYRKLHNTTDTSSRRRLIRALEIAMGSGDIPLNSHKHSQVRQPVFGIHFERGIIRKRISDRLNERLENGMVEEVQGLLDGGVPAERLLHYGLEYRYITRHLLGELSYPEMVRLLEIAIHQFAKRQMTWFRGMEKRGIHVNWIDGNLPEEEKVRRIMEVVTR